MSKVQSFMKFAFLRLIELFYLYVFPISTPRGINAVSLRRKLKDSVGSQRALFKKNLYASLPGATFPTKATRKDSEVLAVTGQFPTGGRTPHPHNGSR